MNQFWENNKVFLSPSGAIIALVSLFLPWVNNSIMGIGQAIPGTEISGIFPVSFIAVGVILGAFIYYSSKSILSNARLPILISSGVALLIILVSIFSSGGSGQVAFGFESSIQYGAILTIIGFTLAMSGVAFLKETKDDEISERNEMDIGKSEAAVGGPSDRGILNNDNAENRGSNNVVDRINQMNNSSFKDIESPRLSSKKDFQKVNLEYPSSQKYNLEFFNKFHVFNEDIPSSIFAFTPSLMFAIGYIAVIISVFYENPIFDFIKDSSLIKAFSDAMMNVYGMLGITNPSESININIPDWKVYPVLFLLIFGYWFAYKQGKYLKKDKHFKWNNLNISSNKFWLISWLRRNYIIMSILVIASIPAFLEMLNLFPFKEFIHYGTIMCFLLLFASLLLIFLFYGLVSVFAPFNLPQINQKDAKNADLALLKLNNLMRLYNHNHEDDMVESLIQDALWYADKIRNKKLQKSIKEDINSVISQIK